MRAHAPGEANLGSVALDHLVEALTGERATSEVDEQPRDGPRSHQVRPACAQIARDRGRGLTPERDDALLVPLAAGADERAAKVDVVHVEADHLRGPQAAAVHHLK